MRDLLIDRRPFFWDSRWEYVPLIVGMTVAFVYSARLHRVARLLHDRAFFIDALGLGLFSLTGLSYARAAGLAPFVAVLIGVLTGTGGGGCSPSATASPSPTRPGCASRRTATRRPP